VNILLRTHFVGYFPRNFWRHHKLHGCHRPLDIALLLALWLLVMLCMMGLRDTCRNR